MLHLCLVMTLSEAIRELRRTANKSQQVLATELAIATKTLQLYESGRATPEPKNLLALAAYADRLDNDALYEVFMGDALMDQLGEDDAQPRPAATAASSD